MEELLKKQNYCGSHTFVRCCHLYWFEVRGPWIDGCWIVEWCLVSASSRQLVCDYCVVATICSRHKSELLYIYSSWMELFSLSWLAFSRWWFGKWMVANWSVCGFWCRSLRLVVNCKFAGSRNQLHWMFSWLAVVFFFLLPVFKAVFGRRNCLRKVSFCSLWLFFMCCESMFLV